MRETCVRNPSGPLIIGERRMPGKSTQCKRGIPGLHTVLVYANYGRLVVDIAFRIELNTYPD